MRRCPLLCCVAVWTERHVFEEAAGGLRALFSWLPSAVDGWVEVEGVTVNTRRLGPSWKGARSAEEARYQVRPRPLLPVRRTVASSCLVAACCRSSVGGWWPLQGCNACRRCPCRKYDYTGLYRASLRVLRVLLSTAMCAVLACLCSYDMCRRR